MNVSFAWTTAAFLDGSKRETRRFWKPQYAERFKAGQVHTAIDKDFRAGGKKVGRFIVTVDPFKQRLGDMTETSFWAEGGRRYWNSRRVYINAMGGADRVPWVICFNPCDENGIPVPDSLDRYLAEPFIEDWLENFDRFQVELAQSIIDTIKTGERQCHELMHLRPERSLGYLLTHNASVKALSTKLIGYCKELDTVERCPRCNRHFIVLRNRTLEYCDSCYKQLNNRAAGQK